MPISYKNIKNNSHQFIIDYKDAVKENAESQSFLNDFFAIFGINRRRVASFEMPVKVDDNGINQGIKRIDLFWQGVLLVEMKSTGKDLTKAYQQGIGYFKGLTDVQLPRYVMVCDLNTFKLYDLDDGKDYSFTLAELTQNLHLFDFMQGKQGQDITEYELNEQAALLLGELHDALEESGFIGHELQVFMVRILFCLFAEDTGVFERHQFTRYLLQFTDENGFDTELHLHKLFQVLDKNETTRNKNLTDELQAFPYVNGHLFKERIELPSFTKAMRDQLIECCLFNWKEISPAIFGSLFQSIMNKENRRSLGAHYTSEINILRTIQPLFLTELQQQITKTSKLKNSKQRNQQLIELMAKVRQLSFLDPACGCGNFLIITYRELRRLELQLLQAQQQNQQQAHIDIEIEPQIPLNNFYGIEIDEWPARIAEVAMWLTQHQMNLEFAKAFGKEPDLLPLKEHANIKHGNALELDWNEVIKAEQLDYIIGNPPFVGSKYQTKGQKALQNNIFGKLKNSKQLDFVANWFYKATQYANEENINIALVATNSITMGEQVGVLWPPILALGYKIDFAHRTFQWSNEASGKGAAVHCVIIGLSQQATENKIIYDYADIKGEPIAMQTDNINPYLIDAPDVVMQSNNQRFAPNPMWFGNMPMDGGFLLLNEQEKTELCQKSPGVGVWIKPVLGAREFLNAGNRYCLWLADANSSELRKLMKVAEIKCRIEGVKQMRLSSSDKGTRKQAESPWKFRDTRTPNTYILVPSVSSERRPYVPMGFFDKNTISTNANLMIPNASLYEFGILTSQMHMDWMRTIAGRLKSDYRYSAKLVYNNFPWAEATEQQQSKIKQLAQAILDARQVHFDQDNKTTLSDLYDPDLMPPNLRKAHQTLDKAVDKLYDKKAFKTPLSRVKHLFERYQQLVNT